MIYIEKTTSPGLRLGALYYDVALIYCEQTRHRGSTVVYQTLQGLPYPAPMVKGVVTAPNHPPLKLTGWHLGIRQRQATWGQMNGNRAVD